MLVIWDVQPYSLVTLIVTVVSIAQQLEGHVLVTVVVHVCLLTVSMGAHFTSITQFVLVQALLNADLVGVMGRAMRAVYLVLCWYVVDVLRQHTIRVVAHLPAVIVLTPLLVISHF